MSLDVPYYSTANLDSCNKESSWPTLACRLDNAIIMSLYPRLRTHTKWIGARYGLPRDQWEDLLQDSICSLCASQVELTSAEHLMGVFHLILKHRVIDARRMERALKRVHSSSQIRMETLAETLRCSEIGSPDTSIIVRDLLRSLTPEEMTIAYARFYRSQSLQGIAEDQGTSITTIHRKIEIILIKLAGLDSR